MPDNQPSAWDKHPRTLDIWYKTFLQKKKSELSSEDGSDMAMRTKRKAEGEAKKAKQKKGRRNKKS